MKAFNVLLLTSKPESKEAVVARLNSLGATIEESIEVPLAHMIKVLPTDQSISCASLRDEVRQVIDVFEDKVIVAMIAPDYVKYINWKSAEDHEGSLEGGDLPKRNFERFKTRHEAYLAFDKEKPAWTYNDGLRVGIKMEFSEWCWLPVKSDGLYEQRVFEKYLRG